MANHKELDDALLLVENLATTEQIQELLRGHKGHESVRITAANKNEVVTRNLREAIEGKAIDIESVFNLIRSSEENGNQHIFYYKVKSRAIADALSFENLAPRMWGANWKKRLKDEFPSIRLLPNDYKNSDFRQLPKKPKDWILKIYGETTIERYTGDEELEGDEFFWRKFKHIQLRSVLIARWNSPDLLEIRVDRNESRRRVEEWHNTVWEMLKPHVIRSQFDPWELSTSMKQLVTKQVGNEKVYNFRDAKVIDKSRIHVSFHTEADSGSSLFASDETRESLQSYLQAKSDFDGLTVTWLPQSDDTPSKEMRTLLGAKQTQEMKRLIGDRTSHEMIVQAHCNAEDLDYVTAQLRTFNK